jgi:hypothetical protein
MEGISCPEAVEMNKRVACSVIDGQAIIVAIGKPQNSETLGDLADMLMLSLTVILMFPSQLRRGQGDQRQSN